MKKAERNQIINEVLNLGIKFGADLDSKIRKRCLLEGCRFGYQMINKEPKDNCIYCGESRVLIFEIPSIRKSLKKLEIKGL